MSTIIAIIYRKTAIIPSVLIVIACCRTIGWSATAQEVTTIWIIALYIGDIDGFIGSINQVTIAYGGKPAFNNMQDLEIIMDSDSPIRL